MVLPIPPGKIVCARCGWKRRVPGSPSDVIDPVSMIAMGATQSQCPRCGSKALRHERLTVLERLAGGWLWPGRW